MLACPSLSTCIISRHLLCLLCTLLSVITAGVGGSSWLHFRKYPTFTCIHSFNSIDAKQCLVLWSEYCVCSMTLFFLHLCIYFVWTETPAKTFSFAILPSNKTDFFQMHGSLPHPTHSVGLWDCDSGTVTVSRKMCAGTPVNQVTVAGFVLPKLVTSTWRISGLRKVPSVSLRYIAANRF